MDSNPWAREVDLGYDPYQRKCPESWRCFHIGEEVTIKRHVFRVVEVSVPTRQLILVPVRKAGNKKEWGRNKKRRGR